MPTYGTTLENGGDNPDHNGNDETSALLAKPSGHAVTNRIKNYMTAKLDHSWADLVLLVGYIVTGLLDSSTVYVYGCFASMQTGNTIYLGLGIVEPNSGTRYIRSGASIIAYCFGSFFFSRLHMTFVSDKRWVLVVSYFLQLLLTMGAALMVTFGPEVTKDGPVTIWVIAPLAMIALQSAGQAVTSRALKYNGVTSVVLTSSYTDLFSDPKLFSLNFKDNPERNRRLVSPFLLLIGAVLGGLFEHSIHGNSGALWTATGIKAVIVVIWLFWKEDPNPEES